MVPLTVAGQCRPTIRRTIRVFNGNNINYPYGRADAALNLEKVVIQGYEYQLRWQPFRDDPGTL